jgi:hypothetical protein
MKPYLLLIFMLIANPVWAEWTKASAGEGIDFYIDLDTIRVDGSKRKVWQLMNFSTPQNLNGFEFSSIRIRGEYDCKEDKSRVLAVTSFPKQFAGGIPIQTSEEISNWKDLAPSSTGWDSLKMACKVFAR